jgi:cobalamin biosynthesis protein CbiD
MEKFYEGTRDYEDLKNIQKEKIYNDLPPEPQKRMLRIMGEFYDSLNRLGNKNTLVFIAIFLKLLKSILNLESREVEATKTTHTQNESHFKEYEEAQRLIKVVNQEIEQLQPKKRENVINALIELMNNRLEHEISRLNQENQETGIIKKIKEKKI